MLAVRARIVPPPMRFNFKETALLQHRDMPALIKDTVMSLFVTMTLVGEM